MKNFTISLIIIISFLTSNAQDITIHGFLPVNDPDTEFLRLGSLDVTTGDIIEEDSIYPVNAYALGSSTFDAVSGAFMFIGVDTAFSFKLYTRQLRTQTTLFDPEFGTTINDLQYDMNSMNTYGLGNYRNDSTLIDSIHNIWMYNYATRFLKVDQDSGFVTELNQMPDISAFPVGSSTFDANLGRYILNAYDTAFTERLVIIDASTGNILSKEPTDLPSGTYLNNLQYNNEDDKVYGLYRDQSDSLAALISLDISNENQVDTIYVFDDLKYFVQGSAVLHQGSQTYIMYYVNTDNTDRFAVIDLATGERAYNTLVNEYITEIEADNYEYAIQKYHGTVGLEQGIQKTNSFNIYPNPLFQGSDLRYSGTGLIREVSIFDLSGRLISSKYPDPENGIIETSGLTPGLYFISFQAATKREVHKLVIR